MFEKFHEILFWPLELSAKSALTPDAIEEWIGENCKGKPWRVIDPYDRGTAPCAETRYAEFVYFHPFVRRFLYPGTADKQHLKILVRDDVQQVHIQLGCGHFDGILKVNRVHLYIFQTNVAILVVEVESTVPLTRIDGMAMLEQFRKVYAPYWFDKKGGKCPKLVQWQDKAGMPIGPPSTYHHFEAQKQSVEDADWRRPPVSEHWNWLLAGLLESCPKNERKEKQLYFDQIEDERMPAMCFITTAAPHHLSLPDLQRLCFFDEATDNPCSSTYSPFFLKDFVQNHCYDRYWDAENSVNSWMSTRYLCSGYGFTVLGQAGNGFVEDAASGLLAHFRHHYFQLGLIAHFHRASLLQFSRRFSESVQSEKNRDEQLNRDFAQFVTGYWFNEVSNQMQGSELFQFWAGQLGNQKLLEHVVREKRLAIELDESSKIQEDGKRVKSLTEALTTLTMLLVPLTVDIAVIAWLDMDFTRHHLEYLKDGWFWWILAASLTLMTFVAFFIGRIRSKKENS